MNWLSKILNITAKFIGTNSRVEQTFKIAENLTKNKNTQENKKIENATNLSNKTKKQNNFLKKLSPKNSIVEKINNILNKINEPDDVKNRRINNIYKQKLNLAGKYNTLGSNSEDKRHLFYQATQNIWENAPIEKRNEVIIKKLGVQNLEQAYKLISETNEFKEALKELKKWKRKNKHTLNDERYKNDKEKFHEASPPKLLTFGLNLTVNGKTINRISAGSLNGK